MDLAAADAGGLSSLFLSSYAAAVAAEATPAATAVATTAVAVATTTVAVAASTAKNALRYG